MEISWNYVPGCWWKNKAKQYSRMLVKIFLLELLILAIQALPPVSGEGQSTLSSSSAVTVAQLCLCYYISTSPMSLIHGWIPKPGSGNTSLPVEWIQTFCQQACFSFLSAVDPLEVVYGSSGSVVHRWKTADLDKYLNKSDLLTSLGFIFLWSGYLLVPYSYNIHLQLEYGRQLFLRAFFPSWRLSVL